MDDWLGKLSHPIPEIRKRHLKALADKISWQIIKISDLANDPAFYDCLKRLKKDFTDADSQILINTISQLAEPFNEKYSELIDVNLRVPLAKPQKAKSESPQFIPHHNIPEKANTEPIKPRFVSNWVVPAAYLSESQIHLSAIQKYLVEEFVRLGSQTGDFLSISFELNLHRLLNNVPATIFLQDSRLTSILWQYLIIESTTDAALHHCSVVAERMQKDVLYEFSTKSTNELNAMIPSLAYFANQMFIRGLPLCRFERFVTRSLKLVSFVSKFILLYFLEVLKASEAPLVTSYSIASYYFQFYAEILSFYENYHLSRDLDSVELYSDAILCNCTDLLTSMKNLFSQNFSMTFSLRPLISRLLELKSFSQIAVFNLYRLLDSFDSPSDDAEILLRIIEAKWLFSRDMRFREYASYYLNSIIPSEAEIVVEKKSDAFVFEMGVTDVNFSTVTSSSNESAEDIILSLKTQSIMEISNIMERLKLGKSVILESLLDSYFFMEILVCASKLSVGVEKDVREAISYFFSRFFVEIWNNHPGLLADLIDCMFVLSKRSQLKAEEFIKCLGLLLPFAFHGETFVRISIARFLDGLLFSDSVFSFMEISEESDSMIHSGRWIHSQFGFFSETCQSAFKTLNQEELEIELLNVRCFRKHFPLPNKLSESELFHEILEAKNHDQCHKILRTYSLIFHSLTECKRDWTPIMSRYFSVAPTTIEDFRLVRHLTWVIIETRNYLYASGYSIVAILIKLMKNVLEMFPDPQKALLFLDPLSVEWKLLLDDLSECINNFGLESSLSPASVMTLIDFTRSDEFIFVNTNLYLAILRAVDEGVYDKGDVLTSVYKWISSSILGTLANDPDMIAPVSKHFLWSLSLFSKVIARLVIVCGPGCTETVTKDSALDQYLPMLLRCKEPNVTKLAWNILCAFLEAPFLISQTSKRVPFFLDDSLAALIDSRPNAGFESRMAKVQATVVFINTLSNVSLLKDEAPKFLDIFEKHCLLTRISNSEEMLSNLLYILVNFIHYCPDELVPLLTSGNYPLITRCAETLILSKVSKDQSAKIISSKYRALHNPINELSLILIARCVRWMRLHVSGNENDEKEKSPDLLWLSKIVNIIPILFLNRSKIPEASMGELLSILSDLFYLKKGMSLELLKSHPEVFDSMLEIAMKAKASRVSQYAILNIICYFQVIDERSVKLDDFVNFLVSKFTSNSPDLEIVSAGLVAIASRLPEYISDNQFRSLLHYMGTSQSSESTPVRSQYIFLLYHLLLAKPHVKANYGPCLSFALDIGCSRNKSFDATKRNNCWGIVVMILCQADEDIVMIRHFLDFQGSKDGYENEAIHFILSHLTKSDSAWPPYMFETLKLLIKNPESRSILLKARVISKIQDYFMANAKTPKDFSAFICKSNHIAVRLVSIMTLLSPYPEVKIAALKHAELINLLMEILSQTNAHKDLKLWILYFFIELSFNKDIKYIFLSSTNLNAAMENCLSSRDNDLVKYTGNWISVYTYNFQKAKSSLAAANLIKN